MSSLQTQEEEDASLALLISQRQSRKCRTKSIDETLSLLEEANQQSVANNESSTESKEQTFPKLLAPKKPSISKAKSNLLSKSAPFHKFVLTGGPCGGKTTALARLSSYLRERGFEVITVPEAFTILASNGFQPSFFAVDGMPFCVQNSVMDMQIALEDSFERVLRAKGKPSVLLCDRGVCDGAAYMEQEEWSQFLNERNVSSADIRESRYNAVFHLVTAAEGAEKYYTLENNEARTESPEQARELDKKGRLAWLGHPKLFVIDNTTDFEGKLNKLVSIATELVGLPSTSKQITVKYLLQQGKIPDIASFPKELDYQLFDVEKVYLYDTENTEYAEEYSFIRKRTHLSKDGTRSLGTSYGLTTVHITESGKQIEVKRIITPREYNAAYKTRDENRHVVKQRRISFLWNMKSFNVHLYQEPLNVKDLGIVHVQQQENSDDIQNIQENLSSSSISEDGKILKKKGSMEDLPDFLDIERRLSDGREDQKKYGAYSISLNEDGDGN